MGIDRSARPSRSALPDDECEPLAQGTIRTRGESDTSTTTRRCTAPAVRSRWGNPSNRKVADIYVSTPALRHWEAPRRTTVDARNQPADKRMINRRLKPHRRPCAHFWSGSKPYGSPPGREEFVAPAVDNGHKRRFHHVINSDKVFGTHNHRNLANEATLDVVQQYHRLLGQRLADEAALISRRTAILDRLHERE